MTISWSFSYYTIRSLKHDFLVWIRLCGLRLDGRYKRMRDLKLFSYFSTKTYVVGECSKEPSQWDGSFEHPKQMLKLMGKKIFTVLCSKSCLSWHMVCTDLTFINCHTLYVSAVMALVRLVVIASASFLCELIWYVIFFSSDLQNEQVALLVADPQLQGYQDEAIFPVGQLARWDIDRLVLTTQYQDFHWLNNEFWEFMCLLRGLQWLSARSVWQDGGVVGSSLTGGNVLCPWARHFILCLVLVQPRNICLTWRKNC